MGDDTASRIGWGVVLGGEALDLEDWREALKQPFDPWVMETEDEPILRSSLLNPATTASEAYELAKVLMEQVNGALGVSHGARLVRLESIAEILSDGTRRRQAFAHRSEGARVKDRPTAEVFGADGKPKPQPPPAKSDPQRWLSIAAQDDLLADALTYFARGADWFDTYKTLECLIQRFCGGDPKKFLALGWADPDEIKRLRATANSYRHSRGNPGPRPRPSPMQQTEANPGPRPRPSPMQQTEARGLLAKLIARAFREAATNRPPRGAKAGRNSPG